MGTFKRASPRPVATLAEACAVVGIKEPRKTSGRFVRTPTENARAGDGSGCISFFADGAGGIAFNWRTGESQMFVYGYDGHRLSRAELAEQKRKAAEMAAYVAAMFREQYLRGAELAGRIISECRQADPDHPYLKRKGIETCAAELLEISRTTAQAIINSMTPVVAGEPTQGLGMLTERLLVVPLHATPSDLMSVEFIDEAGTKRLLKGAQSGGCFFLPRRTMSSYPTGPWGIAEGVATAWSVFMMERVPCLAAISAGNLPKVALAASRLFPHARFALFADEDASGVGQRYAERARLEIPLGRQAGLFLPGFTADEVNLFAERNGGTRPSDFNDAMQLRRWGQ